MSSILPLNLPDCAEGECIAMGELCVGSLCLSLVGWKKAVGRFGER